MEKKLTVEKIVADGYGLARDNGDVYFIKRVLPGETLIVKKAEKKRGVFFAKEYELYEKSEKRIEPECRYFGTCGGCELQHAPYEMQIDFKNEILRETFKRIGGIDSLHINDVLVGNEWNYRYRARIHVKDGATGFRKENSYEVIDIEACPILKEAINKGFNILKEIFKESKTRSEFVDNLNAFELRTNFQENQLGVLFITPTGQGSKQFASKVYEKLLDYFDEAGVWISYSKTPAPGKGFRLLYGVDRLHSQFEEITAVFSPLSFFQPNLRLALKVYKKIDSLLNELNSKKIIDLYSGAGMLELISGKKFEMIGVEENKYAVEDARVNSFLNEVSAEFVEADAGELEAIEEADTVVINPPSGGISKKLVRTLSESKSLRSIIYLSCNPSTLARDVRELIGMGKFKITGVYLIDFYPQTAHIETLLTLVR